MAKKRKNCSRGLVLRLHSRIAAFFLRLRGFLTFHFRAEIYDRIYFALREPQPIIGSSRVNRRFREAFPRLSSLALRPRYRACVPPRILDAINWVASHSGSHAHIRNAVAVPKSLRQNCRHLFSTTGQSTPLSWWERRRLKAADAALDEICHRVLFLIGASGHLPLTETWQTPSALSPMPRPKFMALVDGLEVGTALHVGASHKLSVDFSTVNPHRPIGNSLFEDSGLDVGELCPDLVVYICVHSNPLKKYLGGQAIDLDCIRKEVAEGQGSSEESSTFLKTLATSQYQLIGETLKGHEFFSFMSNDRMNVLGARENDRKYMRYDRRRIRAPLGGKYQTALDNLGAALDRLSATHPCVDLKAGDIWVVNNRRVATRWELTCGWKIPLKRPANVEFGDRTILRMSFYSPTSRI